MRSFSSAISALSSGTRSAGAARNLLIRLSSRSRSVLISTAFADEYRMLWFHGLSALPPSSSRLAFDANPKLAPQISARALVTSRPSAGCLS